MSRSSENIIFVYGTLSFDEILSALLDREVKGQTATITGYQRRQIKNKRYPGVIAAKPDDVVEGFIHQRINDDEAALVDAFEDNFYKKESLKAELKNGQSVFADVYVVAPENLQFVSDNIWNRDGFREKHFQDYIKMAGDFRREYLLDHHRS